jgi:hypothetical protein
MIGDFHGSEKSGRGFPQPAMARNDQLLCMSRLAGKMIKWQQVMMVDNFLSSPYLPTRCVGANSPKKKPFSVSHDMSQFENYCAIIIELWN